MMSASNWMRNRGKLVRKLTRTNKIDNDIMVKEHLFGTITYILTPLQSNLVNPDPLLSIFIIIIVTSHTARLGCL